MKIKVVGTSSVAWLAAATLLTAACGAVSGAEQGERSTQGVDAPRSATPATGGEAARGSARAPGTIKVATWNLEWLNRENKSGPVKRDDDDYARLRSYAKKLDADVVALQEVDGVEAAARVFDTDVYELYVAAQSDPLRTGFAYRKGLSVTIHPDYAALDVGQVRVGADLSIDVQGTTLRLLSVHLKSGCFDQPLTSTKKDCRKLAAQVPSLEAWIDGRAADGSAAIVLGDFNRRLFATQSDELWLAIDDAEPPASDLWSPTAGRTSRCWDGEHPAFIDHIVLNKPATAWVASDGFEELLYAASDARHQSTLSDHCPLALTLTPRAGAATSGSVPLASGSTTALANRGTQVADGSTRAPIHDASSVALRIKGNLSSGGRKLYHEATCPDYGRTQIDEAKGERWFDSAAQAEAAGFTRSSNCPK